MKDLHIHTIYSDGEYDEYEIIERIKKAGIKEFAICDHNIYTGSRKVYDVLTSTNSDLIFHSGIELTCRLKDYNIPLNMHILVRDFPFGNKDIDYLVNTYQKYESIKLERMIKKVKELYDVDIPQSDISEAYKHSLTIGKPHIYTMLSKYKNIDMKQYYKDMDDLNTDDLKLDTLEVISISNKIGASVILAHPIEIMEDHDLSFSDIDELCGFLKKKGLDEIETRHSKHDEKYYNEFHNIAIRHGLKESMGSDYHGEKVKPNVKLGKCYKE